MESAIERFTVLSYLIIGLSHILQPRVWVQFFLNLRDKGEAGIFAIAFLHLPLGLLIVSFHNVWTGIPAVVTVVGWANVLKGTLYFLFPAIGMKTVGRVRIERAHEFVIAGAVLVIMLIALVAYDMITAL
jgi:hypothetical protein